MQEEKKEPPAAVPAGGKQPSFCDRLQRAFHVRPAAFRPLRRLTEDGAAKPADAAPAEPPRKHSGPPVPAPPRSLTSSPSPVGRRHPQPAPVRLPAVTTPTSNVANKNKAPGSSVPTGLPVPAPPPDVTTGGVQAADEKTGDKAQQTKGKNRVSFSFRVRNALSSK